MRETIIKLYKFYELSEYAKEKAREWYREGAFDYEWWDSVYEDAKTIGAILGIDMNHKGKDPCIWFSGFSSQGDGACFEGSYTYAKNAPKKIREYAPKDTELHKIADGLQALQRKHFYSISATVRHSYRYYFAESTDIDVIDSRTEDAPIDDAEETLKDLLRDFMYWIYRTLEKEYDYLTSNEYIDEIIEANEYEFTEDGERA